MTLLLLWLIGAGISQALCEVEETSYKNNWKTAIKSELKYLVFWPSVLGKFIRKQLFKNHY